MSDVRRFYEHFEGKEDLLRQSVGRPLCALAAATVTGTRCDELRNVLTHLAAQRTLANALMREPARAFLIHVLARELERHLTTVARRTAARPIAPLPFLAMSLAHAEVGAVDAWLSGDVRCDAQTAARVLHATTRAGIAAMFEPSR